MSPKVIYGQVPVFSYFFGRAAEMAASPLQTWAGRGCAASQTSIKSFFSTTAPLSSPPAKHDIDRVDFLPEFEQTSAA